MSAQFLFTIGLNLGILLIASWVLGLLVFTRLLKDKQSLERQLLALKQSSKQQSQQQSQQQPTQAQTTAVPEYPLEPLTHPETAAATEDFLNTINRLKNELSNNEQQLLALSKLQDQQHATLHQQQDQAIDSDTLLDNHAQSQHIIAQLQLDLSHSQATIGELENTLQQNHHKDERIAILEKNEQRLHERVNSLKNSQSQLTQLAEGLRAANEKNKSLSTENTKLKNNLKILGNVSKEQLATISKISAELDKASKLEQHQQQLILQLKDKLIDARKKDNNHDQVSALELELKELSATLERTLREKDFIESHLIEMDKSLEKTKETEQALRKAQAEIEKLGEKFPDLKKNEDMGTQTADTTSETCKPLPQLRITATAQPALYEIVNDNRLFGILQEFWMTLDTPPLQLVAEAPVERPNNLQHWIKTAIADDEFLVLIGASQALITSLTRAMFNKVDHNTTENEQQDALGELGNIIAGNLANELNPDYIVGIPEPLEDDKLIEQLQQLHIATEVLANAGKQPLYLALAKPNPLEDE
ncbi:MAG: chemotaxis protein CheX [Cellvibrionaceae bacterium]|nr:chemotaxis protein CheX [Cellvibrionaceae bacterium]